MSLREMSLVRWDPFREVTQVHDTMDRLFKSPWGRPGLLDHGLIATEWAPAVDVYEKDKEIILEAELPGVSMKDITLEVKENVLTLSGERRRESEIHDEGYHRSERFYGKFYRSFILPETVEGEKVTARAKDGIIEVRMPKAPKAVSKRIAVKVE